MNSKRTIKRRSKHRKKTVRRGAPLKKYRKGGADDALTEQQKKEAVAYIQLINNYTERQTQKGTQMNLEAVKYTLFKKKFEEIKAIEAKLDNNTITQDELKQLESIVFFIIKDEVSAYGMFFDEKSAGFQIWIDNFVKYLINDAPFENDITIKLIEGIKRRPYLKTSVAKNYNHFISDVNNLFARLKSELSENSKNDVIKETKLKVNANVEAVPE
jgi:hypothetical protein